MKSLLLICRYVGNGELRVGARAAEVVSLSLTCWVPEAGRAICCQSKYQIASGTMAILVVIVELPLSCHIVLECIFMTRDVDSRDKLIYNLDN